jgi:hypothetical protein
VGVDWLISSTLVFVLYTDQQPLSALTHATQISRSVLPHSLHPANNPEIGLKGKGFLVQFHSCFTPHAPPLTSRRSLSSEHKSSIAQHRPNFLLVTLHSVQASPTKGTTLSFHAAQRLKIPVIPVSVIQSSSGNTQPSNRPLRSGSQSTGRVVGFLRDQPIQQSFCPILPPQSIGFSRWRPRPNGLPVVKKVRRLQVLPTALPQTHASTEEATVSSSFSPRGKPFP